MPKVKETPINLAGMVSTITLMYLFIPLTDLFKHIFPCPKSVSVHLTELNSSLASGCF